MRHSGIDMTVTPEARIVRAADRNEELPLIPPEVLGLENCPQAGGGVHDWLFSTACQLVRKY